MGLGNVALCVEGAVTILHANNMLFILCEICAVLDFGALRFAVRFNRGGRKAPKSDTAQRTQRKNDQFFQCKV